MISHQKISSALQEIKEITGRGAALYHVNGKPVAEVVSEPEHAKAVVTSYIEREMELPWEDAYAIVPIWMEGEQEYFLLFEDEAKDGQTLAKLAASQIRTVIASMEEHYDRNQFVRNILLGNLLSVDIFTRARKLHIEAGSRVVFVIDTGDKKNDMAMELVRNLSDIKTRDFVTNVDEHSVVLVKDVSAIAQEQMDAHLETIAKSLVDNLHMEAMIKVRVGYGNVVYQISELAESYQEARLALMVGRIFYAERDTISYGKLGIGRLIYQLPMSLCNMYIREVFGDRVPDILDDEEAMSTINKFFENNLNISETARQLYVHRNTLVYRLERIEKSIGLDIRKFDDAMTFRIAVMVLAHIRRQRELDV